MPFNPFRGDAQAGERFLPKARSRSKGDMRVTDECNLIGKMKGVGWSSIAMIILDDVRPETLTETLPETSPETLQETQSTVHHSRHIQEAFAILDGCTAPNSDRRGLDAGLQLVRGTAYGVVLLVAGHRQTLADVAFAVASLRRESQNPDIHILLCGPLCILDPRAALTTGADAGFATLSQALDLASNIVGEQGA